MDVIVELCQFCSVSVVLSMKKKKKEGKFLLELL